MTDKTSMHALDVAWAEWLRQTAIDERSTWTAFKAAFLWNTLSGEREQHHETSSYSQQYADHMRTALLHISTVSTLKEAHELAFNGLNSFALKA